MLLRRYFDDTNHIFDGEKLEKIIGGGGGAGTYSYVYLPIIQTFDTSG